jgi:exosortase A
MVLVLAAFADTWRAMVGVWWGSETFNHGFLVAPISAWLAWRQRAQLSAMHPSPSWLGIAMLALSCIAWLAAELAGINVVAQFAVTGMAIAVVVTLVGWRVARSIAFPLAFLFFMVPAGDVLNSPLMEGTAEATIRAIQAVGIPVFREGLHFTLPTGRWSVVEACSGLRYVIASALLASLFAYLNFRLIHKQVLFVMIALGIAVVANWTRAFLIVMIGHFSGMTWGVGDDHVVYGWVFFGMVMFAVFWMGARWSDSAGEPTSKRLDLKSVELDTDSISRGWGLRRLLPHSAAALAVGAATLAALGAMRDVSVWPDFASDVSLAMGPGNGSPLPLQPRFPSARATSQGLTDASTGTGWYAAYFARQTDGREMIAYGNTVLDSSDRTWQIMNVAPLTARVGSDSWQVREWSIRSANESMLVWSWYTVGGVAAASDYRAKALTALSMLRGKGDHSSVSVVMTVVKDDYSDEAVARARLEKIAGPLRRLTDQATLR